MAIKKAAKRIVGTHKKSKKAKPAPKLSKAAERVMGLKKLPGKKGYEKTVDVDPKAFKGKAKSKALRTLPDDYEYVSGKDICEEIRKNKDCYAIQLSNTAVVFVKKVEVSVSKINDNPVFQPHEKTEKRTYCILVIFEINPVMEVYHPKEFAKHDISHLYKPFIERGAQVYQISDIDDVQHAIKEME